MSLPITKYKKQILYAIQKNDIILITAQTGSGKTTQIPQFLVQAGYTTPALLNKKQKIGIALPRKIAAISIAKRISDQMGLHHGEIAHHVRFNSTVNQNTRVMLMTDGSMVQKLYQDPLLEEFSVIILDDIHQRSISFQILFGFIKKIMQKRTDLKIIITSATLQQKRIMAFFSTTNYQKKSTLSNRKQVVNDQNQCMSNEAGLQRELQIKCLNISGRLHPVSIQYLKSPCSNYFLKTFQTILFIDKQQYNNKSILCFLTSIQQLEGMYNMIDSYMFQNKRKVNVLMLHAGVTQEVQDKVFSQETQGRKIILATNVAESSITIPDVDFVVDTGYVKCKLYDQQTGIDKMVVIPCGKHSCQQRAGRAGRVSNGYCYRIFTEDAFTRMPQKLPPQIMRIDLTSFLLKLKGLGISDLLSFPFIQPPPQFNLTKSIDTLYAYDLIDPSFNLTQKGKKVAQLSLQFKNGCLLLSSFQERFGCSKEILILVSMLEVHRELWKTTGIGIIKTKKKIGAKEGDFITLVNVFLRYYHAKHYEKRRVCNDMKVKESTMQHALKIHDQLIAQIIKWNRFKNQYQKMSYKWGDSSQPIKKKQIYQIKSSSDVHQTILRCIISGYFPNIAQFQPTTSSYLSIRSSSSLKLHSSSILSTSYPQWIIYHQIVKTSHGSYIHNASEITDVQWVFQIASHYYKDKRKQIKQKQFQKDKQIERMDYQPIRIHNKEQQGQLVQVGGQKKSIAYFKTNVLGLKDKNFNKKNKLSFDEDI